MEEIICKVKEKFGLNSNEYFKLIDSNSEEEYIIPLNQLFDINIFIGSEYKFYKQYNSNLDKYFLIQQHPFYKLKYNYDFEIISKEINTSDKIEAFILKDINNNQIRVKALPFQENELDYKKLNCKVIAFDKNKLVLRNSDFSNLPYNIGSTYEFKIKGFGEFINNKSKFIQSVILESHNNSEISVTAFDWQNEKIWNFPTLNCEVLRFNRYGEPHLRNVDQRHPIFELNKKYDFKVQSLKTKLNLKANKKFNVIELLGEDGCIHETNALPGQMQSFKKGDIIQCVIKSIGYNLILFQTNIKDPYFVTIEKIVQDKELIKYFNMAFSDIENEDSIELIEQYNSFSAFWVFTFCNKILTQYFDDFIKRYDYKSSKKIADLLIIIEDWIINSGIISSFSNSNNQSRKNTIIKAKHQLDKYTRIRDILCIIDEFKQDDYLKNINENVDISTIEDLIYIIRFSDVKMIKDYLLVQYITEILNKLELDKSISYNLKKLDKSLQICKNEFYSDEYEKSFNLSTDNKSLFKSDIDKNKYYALSYCQYQINEKLENYERANYILGKLLRQYFFSISDLRVKEKLLFNAYFCQSHRFQSNANPFHFTEKLEINESKLPENPNCCTDTHNGWLLIKDSYKKQSIIEVNVVKKEFNGFVVTFKGIIGFLPFNHITDKSLKYYSFSKVDFTSTIQCILFSEKFSFFVAKQPDPNSSEFLCRNNLEGSLKINDIVEGEVKRIETYGIFVYSYWGTGLLHVKNISNHFWNKENLENYFREGDSISTKIISLDKDRIELSFKGLVNTTEEYKYFDFVNNVDFGDDFIPLDNEIESCVNFENEEIKYNQLEKAFCFEQYAMLRQSLDDKIHYLRLSKQFFSSVNNSRSYLINIYTNYFELLKLIEEVINDFSIDKIEKIKSEAQIIYNKVKAQEQTLEVYPDSKKLIFFINIISLFNDISESGIHSLYKLLLENSDEKILKTITKITLANNLMISESEENSDFIKKNLKLIKSYIDDGVLSLKETETDKHEREIRTKVKYWQDRIQEDEGENQEFKSTFFTPIPSHDKLKEKEKLVKLLDKTNKKDGLKLKIDLIDGELASKAVIHSSMKTLCAFANTNGGSLFIGIADDKSTVGLEMDYKYLKSTKKDRDGFGVFFDSKIKEYFEPSFSSLLKRDFLKFPDGDVLIVSVDSSFEPVFLLKDEEAKPCEDLFVRELTSTKKIASKRDLVKFVKQKEKAYMKTKIDE